MLYILDKVRYKRKVQYVILCWSFKEVNRFRQLIFGKGLDKEKSRNRLNPVTFYDAIFEHTT